MAGIDPRQDPRSPRVWGFGRWVGFGAGYADYLALVQNDPQFAAAWGDVQTQLVAEGGAALNPLVNQASGVVNQATGAASDAFTGAKIQLADAFTQLAGSSFGSTAVNLYDTAKQYVLVGQTALGSINTVAGLVNQPGATSGTPQAALAFTGTMVGTLTTLAISAGAVTAGLGALIVAGIGATLALIQQSGLLGQAPSAGSICGFPLNVKPDFTVGCLGAWAPVITPGSEIWRPFPDANNAADAAWFEGASKHVGPGRWRDGFFGIRGPDQDQGYAGGPNPAGTNVRPIDNAFPSFSQYENWDPIIVQWWIGQGVDPANISRFMVAWATAWKANAAYGLNGVQPQPDWAVLVHLVRMWNKAHTASVQASFPTDPQAISSYLITQAIGASIPSSEFASLNMGPVRSVPVTTGARGILGTSAPTSTQTKVATAVVAAPAALALGTVVYAWATGRAVDTVFHHLWTVARAGWDHVTRGARENPLALFERQSTTVQTLLFPRSRFDARSARSWARSHGYRAGKAHVSGEHIRVRQRDPGEFRRSSFRTIAFGGSGIQAVIGHLRED